MVLTAGARPLSPALLLRGTFLPLPTGGTPWCISLRLSRAENLYMAGQAGHPGTVGPPSCPAPLNPGLACIPLSGPDADAAARLYTRVFLADEPTSRCCALDPARFLPYARFYVRSLVGKDLSFVVRDEATGDLAGFIFCLDLTHDLAEEGPLMAEFLAHFRPVVVMIDELESRHLAPDQTPAGSALHLFQIGVAPEYRQRGLATALIGRALAHARGRGFRQAVADCTNAPSKQVFARCGFSERGYTPYGAFILDGDRPFAALDGGLSLMVRDVDPAP